MTHYLSKQSLPSSFDLLKIYHLQYLLLSFIYLLTDEVTSDYEGSQKHLGQLNGERENTFFCLVILHAAMLSCSIAVYSVAHFGAQFFNQM